MKILVTGGAGFIGSHIVEDLLAQGLEVVVIDNLSTGRLENIKYLWGKFGKQKLEFIKKDIVDIKNYKNIKNIDAIIHLVAIVSVPQSVDNPTETNLVTLGGIINTFEYARQNNIKKVIFASSAAVYGDPKKLPIKEKEVGKFLSPYAISKYVCELYADYYQKNFGVVTTTFRFFNVYGERQDAKNMYSGVITKFVDAFQNKQDINIFGDGKNTRDFIYVKDVSRTICDLVIRKKFSTQNAVYNLGTGKETSLLQLVKILEKIFGYKVRVNFLDPRVGDIKRSVADISQIKKDLKFRPSFSLEKGLRLLVNFVKRGLDE